MKDVIYSIFYGILIYKNKTFFLQYNITIMSRLQTNPEEDMEIVEEGQYESSNTFSAHISGIFLPSLSFSYYCST